MVKPTGDNAQGCGEDGVRRVHGGQEAGQKDEVSEEILGRSAGAMMGKVALLVMAVSVAVLIALSAWLIFL